MSSSGVIPVVLDVGSDSCKAGFAGDNEPKSVLPTVVGRNTEQGISKGEYTSKTYFVGQDALDSGAELIYPVQRGVVVDWETMEVVLNHIFKDKLSVQSSEHPVLVTETPQNPKENKEKMAEVMFEKFKVPAFFSSCQAVLCLYSAGRSTGLVLDIGAGVTTAVPVYEGYSLPEAVVRTNFGGQDITEYLGKLLSDCGHKVDKIHVKNIKEKLCYISQDFDKETSESSKSTPATYTLPDGKVITLDKERFRCTELLFKPSVAGIAEKPGIHEMVNSAISVCELDTRKSLYTNVILSGGSSLFDGIADRLKHELKPFGHLGAESRVSAPKDRILSAWMGGSVLASEPSFQSKWISQKDYQESGSQIVHTRCF